MSLSVDSDFFEGLGFQPSSIGGDGGSEADKFGGRNGISEKRMHRHSSSMDGSSSSFEVETLDSTKKALGPDKLVELALIDPNRAKRFGFFPNKLVEHNGCGMFKWIEDERPCSSTQHTPTSFEGAETSTTEEAASIESVFMKGYLKGVLKGSENQTRLLQEVVDTFSEMELNARRKT
ncbi:uncharacterized protein LOC122659421 [Telopea speciosissima]|uniref:uncharacterized protein LOC122659421 n=1 Tax=Telopea speciosissima TaxID=54955 RepID=UPI001CC35A2A|nr:uncharacterized protein LOC122659421 [Telopea speciosissima]